MRCQPNDPRSVRPHISVSEVLDYCIHRLANPIPRHHTKQWVPYNLKNSLRMLLRYTRDSTDQLR